MMIPASPPSLMLLSFHSITITTITITTTTITTTTITATTTTTTTTTTAIISVLQPCSSIIIPLSRSSTTAIRTIGDGHVLRVPDVR